MKKLSIFLKKIKNTFLTPRWNYIYLDYDNNFTKNNSNRLLFLILNKFWFLPYDVQSRYWHHANKKSRHSFEHYKDLNDEAKLLLNKVMKHATNKNIKILDLGCNIGRHLNFLKKKGFKNLYGVDIGKLPTKQSKKFFPNLKKVNITCASFENYLYQMKDGFFRIIYTHGATIEMTKPTFPLISQISRVLDKSGHLILLIDENGHSYPRFWQHEFKINNLKMIYNKKLIGNHTLFVLKKNTNG